MRTLAILLILMLAGCHTPAPVPVDSATSAAVKDAGPQVAAEGVKVFSAAKAIRAELPSVEKAAPASAGRISGQTIILDASAAKLAALSNEIDALALAVGKLEKANAESADTIAGLQDEISDMQNDHTVLWWIFGVALGIAGVLFAAAIHFKFTPALSGAAGALGVAGAAYCFILVGKTLAYCLVGAVVIILGYATWRALKTIKGAFDGPAKAFDEIEGIAQAAVAAIPAAQADIIAGLTERIAAVKQIMKAQQEAGGFRGFVNKLRGK